jgi:hypothetical protein
MKTNLPLLAIIATLFITACHKEEIGIYNTSTGTNLGVGTLAGSGFAGNVNGTGINASFDNPTGLAVDTGGNVYVADYRNSLIRKITAAGVVTTFAGGVSAGSANGTGTYATFFQPTGVALDAAGNL